MYEKNNYIFQKLMNPKKNIRILDNYANKFSKN